MLVRLQDEHGFSVIHQDDRSVNRESGVRFAVVGGRRKRKKDRGTPGLGMQRSWWFL